MDEVGFGHLPVELFRTRSSNWALDVNRVEFVRVDDVAFDVLDRLRQRELTLPELQALLPGHPRADVEEALAEVVAVQREGYFVPTPFRRTRRFEPEQYRSVLQDRMEGLTLSVTTRCNLACSYCIFGGGYARHAARPERTMTWPVLEHALDFLLAHSRQSRRIRLLFFGGEPLVAFPLIRRAVAHMRAALRGDPRELELVVCTNGTILSDAILAFLVENDVIVQFSLDGDREQHDAHRRFKRSRAGSFERILKNLGTIEQREPAYFRRSVRIKGVVQPAEDRASADVFRTYPISELAPEHVSFILLEPQYEPGQDEEYFRQLDRLGRKLTEKHGVSTLEELLGDLSPNQREFFWQSYVWFFAAQAIERLGHRGHQELAFSKGCMIGAAEGNVGPDGEITVCDKAQIGGAFVIGNVNQGAWDFAAIDRLNGWLHGVDACSSCFAQRFCDLCFEKVRGEEEQLDESRDDYCRFLRRALRVIFRNMLEVLDSNPALRDEVVTYINRRVARERTTRHERLEAERVGVGSPISNGALGGC